MIGSAIKDLFEYICPPSSDGHEIAYQGIRRRNGFMLPSRKVSVNALLALKSNEINFHGASDELSRAIDAMAGEKSKTLHCNWLVCSERGGIYLFEALATKENIRYKNTRNRFIVLNSGDGTISFGPGHEKNMRYTQRMCGMIDAYRSMPPAAWNAELAKFIHELFES